MPCNIAKCRELVAQKKNKADTFPVNGLKQVNTLKILGVTFQENNRFNEHVKTKLLEAIRCLFVLRTLHQEGYMQPDIDSLFAAIVLPKITYGLSVYAASPPDLNAPINIKPGRGGGGAGKDGVLCLGPEIFVKRPWVGRRKIVKLSSRSPPREHKIHKKNRYQSPDITVKSAVTT